MKKRIETNEREEAKTVRLNVCVPLDIHAELKSKAALERVPFYSWLAGQLARLAEKSP